MPGPLATTSLGFFTASPHSRPPSRRSSRKREMDPKKVRELVLQADDNLSSRLYRMPPATTLHIVLDSEFRGECVVFEWNYPEDDTAEFIRSEYHRLTWTEAQEACVHGDRVIVSEMLRPGCFNFRFWIENPDESEPTKVYEGVLIVEPLVRVGGKENTMAGLSIQTVLPPSLGPVEEWWDRIEASANTGFNVIHFCPLQEMGSSRSPFSIRDHRRLEPTIFGKDAADAEAKLADFLNRAAAPRSEGGLGLMFIIDVVYNHTSTDTPWLLEHPEAGYTLVTTPHLQPAYVFDRVMEYFSMLVDQGKIEHHGRQVPAELKQLEDIDFLLDAFFSQTHNTMKLWEFFVIDVPEAIGGFAECFDIVSAIGTSQKELHTGLIRRHNGGGRFSFRIDVEQCAAILKSCNYTLDEATQILQEFIEEYNMEKYIKLEEHMAAARVAMRNAMMYERLAADGPRKGRIRKEKPMVDTTFLHLSLANRQELEDLHQCPLATVDPKYVLVCNGWLWGADPSTDFIAEDIASYLRREVIIWQDCAKLRYGDGPQDNPWLWDYMFTYTKRMARLFAGLRIDNCHSTPLHVGQAMMDAARAENPNILVFAELFTQSEATDIEFINIVGINSLLLEVMGTYSPGEFSAKLHRFGGTPIGSFAALAHRPLQLTSKPPRATLLAASHDNPFPAVRHTVFNSLPLFGLVAMIDNGVGSARCFEELLKENIKVVNEPRQYRPWREGSESWSEAGVDESAGIIRPARKMNLIHKTLDTNGYTEFYVDHIDEHCVSATRRNPDTLEEITTVGFMAYKQEDLHCQPKTLGPFPRSGNVVKVFLRAFPNSYEAVFPKDENVAVGATVSYTVQEDVEPSQVDTIELGDDGNERKWLKITLRPGEIVCFHIAPSKETLDHHQRVHEMLKNLENSMGSKIAAMSAVDVNHALYRCIRENESAPYKDDGVYDIPGYGRLQYAGLAGVIPLIEGIVVSNDLGHPFCDNVRAGDWFLGYLAAHFSKYEGTKFLATFLHNILEHYRHLPRNVKPKLISQILSGLYDAIRKHVILKLLNTTMLAENFGYRLAIATLQFYGFDADYARSNHQDTGGVVTLSAGLPHFAAGWMRCWGRDTFIALRGCLLIPGLFAEAKQLILAFARVVRHGLIPNLFDNGNNPRYNCRDATWFFLQSIKDYIELSDDGLNILKVAVKRKFVTDDPENRQEKEMPLSDVIQEILQRHVDGIKYREWNAGPSIDSDMSDQGFNVTIHVDRETGLVFGGSSMNCGTWMDKMGSSEKAGNKGIPATPRDGADVEIIGLCKSVVSWLARLYNDGRFPYEGLRLQDGSTWTYGQWADALQANFEKHFWIPLAEENQADFAVEQTLIHRRGIYKDVCGSENKYADYQLRPNVAIAMCVAPELFTRSRAQHHLNVCDEALVGGMGMRTLDPEDWQYRPNYDNSNDSDDKAIARGWNYHQGPEWLWPVGFHFRAKLEFSDDRQTAIDETNQYLARHENHIQKSTWSGLPELFNENGSECPHSCPTQAWSIGCLSELLYDIHNHREKSLIPPRDRC